MADVHISLNSFLLNFPLFKKKKENTEKQHTDYCVYIIVLIIITTNLKGYN